VFVDSYRGDGTDRPNVALPPDRMPLLHDRRPLKRWRYVGVYGETMMACAGIVHVAGMLQSFWAVWDKQTLRERTVVGRRGGVVVERGVIAITAKDVHLRLELESDGEPVEVVSPHGQSYIWTRKWPIAASGTLSVDGATQAVAAAGLVDESAGYHARRTAWEWSAGVGTALDGRPVAWNLVAGIHDAAQHSERTVWVDGVAREVGPAGFTPNLDRVEWPGGALRFSEQTRRSRRDQMVLIASDYVQPFGTFAGTVGPGVELAAGYGVMERHRARW
jgi:hypothetical protein